MADSHLKTALETAGLTAEEFAEIVQVDPKTVQRWVAGTSTPYPRHRAKIARALDLTPHQLWPEDTPAPPTDDEKPAEPERLDDRLAAGDVIGSWGHSNHPEAPNPITFLIQAGQLIEIFDSGGTLHQAQDIVEMLRGRAFDGCNIHLLTRAPADQLAGLDTLTGIAVRSTTTLSMPTLLRADDAMLLFIPLYGTPTPALLHLHHNTPDGLCNRLTTHFEAQWDKAEIIPTPTTPHTSTAAGQTQARDTASTPADTTGPGTPPAEGERRWPRRSP